jgi:uncharacterized phiE125 gp8 family phage protein
MDYKVITAVTTEPVTLAEAKIHIKATSGTFSGDTTTSQSIAPGNHDIASSYGHVGNAVEILGKETIVNLNAGSVGTGGSITAKIQDSDDNISWSDYVGGVFTAVTSANDNAIQEIEYDGDRQYVRVVATVAGAACEFSADIILKTGEEEEDTLISDLISAAREYCEEYTRRALATQTIEAYLDRFPCGNDIKLPYPPLQSVASVKYKNSDGVEKVMTEGIDYLVDLDSDIGRIVLSYGKTWPSFTAYPVNPITIRYVAGYSITNHIPRKVKQAMLIHIGYFFNNRDVVELDEQTDRAIKRLIAGNKAGWF